MAARPGPPDIDNMGDGSSVAPPLVFPQPRLIPHVISDRAKNAPQSIWGSIPVSATDASLGYEDITFARLNYAISRTCKWMQDVLGIKKSLPAVNLAYIGPPDTRYVILTVAAIKAGYTMLYLSPRNSEEAQRCVVEEADCRIFLYSKSTEARVQKLLQSHPRLSTMARYIVPEQQELLKDEFVPDFPYERTVEEARYEPLVVLHTSSTTGIPKTIPLNQGYGMHEDVVRHVSEFKGLDIITRKPFYGHCRMFVAMPLYHAGGVLLTLLKSLYQDIVAVFQPPSIALSAESFDAILRYGSCTGCVIPPYLLEEMLAVPEYFDTLASLDFVQFGSGPLSLAAGNKLLTRQNDCPHFIGSSECGLYILLELDDPTTDWQYFRFHPWSGADFRPIDGTNDTCELVIVRSDAPKVPGMQPVFELFPDLKEWPTRDLYVRHPHKPDHWRCIGRNDDVLVLSNGEKLNPSDTEGRIVGVHPDVTGVLVFGAGQFVPGLLLEVNSSYSLDAVERARLLDEIWPAIEATNKDAPGHGQLNKDLILLTSPGKPFLRTPKLSIRRKPTIDLYSVEIAEMYERYAQVQGDISGDDSSWLDLGSVSTIESSLLQRISSEMGWEAQLQSEDDLFALGMDSLQVLRITRLIKRTLSSSRADVEFDTRSFYSNPTIRGLSEAISRLVMPTAGNTVNGHSTESDKATIEALIERYSDFSNKITHAESSITSDGLNGIRQPLKIILTGSTGSLGSFLLLTLLAKPAVGKVYCLNRSMDAKERQIQLFKDYGIDVAKLADFDTKVEFLHSASLGGARLGLSQPGAHDTLQSCGITHIIHNAWPVNFNMTLSSFESHLAGVRNLIDFSSTLEGRPRIIFVSSLSSISSLTGKITVPESIVSNASAPSPMGYGQSKYVAEHILNNAVQASSGKLATMILRVGQIAGPVGSVQAAWPEREWLPSLVTSSKTVQALPSSLGRMETVDWVPVDLLASGISELLDAEQAWHDDEKADYQKQASVLHVVNPSVVTWTDLIKPLSIHIGVKQIVSLPDWTELVRKGPEGDAIARRNPAKKILPFYEALAHAPTEDRNGRKRFDVNKMADYSDTFRSMPAVSLDWLAIWASHWL